MTQGTRETSARKRLLLIAACIVLWILGTFCVIYWTGWLSLPNPEKHAQSRAAAAQLMVLSPEGSPCVQRMQRDGSARQARAQRRTA